MAQEVRLKIGGDLSELEKSFSAFIRKTQGEMEKLKLGPAGKAAAPGVESVREAAQTSRVLSQKIREEKAGLDIINRELSKKKALIDDIARRQEAAIKGSREELALIQRLNKEKERLQQTEKVAQIQSENFRKTQEASNRASGGGSGRNIAGPTMVDRATGGIAATVAGVGLGMAASAVGEGIRKFFSESENRSRVVGASAFQTQGQGGQLINSFLNGGASEEIMFGPLRSQASKIADETMKNRMESQFRIASRPIESVFGRLSQHGTSNAIPGSFTIDQMGFGTESIKKEIENRQAKERADIQSEQFEALKNGPEGALRTVLGNKYNANYQRDLDFQRQTGLSTEGFRGAGGFLSGVQSAGFTGEQGMGMSSSIIGSGGSTRSAIGNAALGLQAQRNLDVTNSGSILGKLSGGLGGAETTKESFVKLLAEGTRIGLDGSDFREENRKFVESAADMISRSGVSTSGGVDQILSQFGRFFGDKTGAGIEAGKGAFELYRQTSMASTGPRATMRAAGMLTDPTISGLSRDSREALFNMPIDQLTPDNPAIIAMARQANTTPQKLIDAQNKITSRSANLFKNSDMARNRLSALKSQYGLTSALGYQGPLTEETRSGITAALGESNISQIKEHPELGQNQRMASEYSDALSAGDTQRQNKALEDAKKQQLGASGTGRPEDETNRLQAEASRLANQLFMSIKDSIVPASDAAKVFAAQINELTAAMSTGNAAQRAAALQKFTTSNPGMLAPSNQPSAGSPNSGGGSGR